MVDCLDLVRMRSMDFSLLKLPSTLDTPALGCPVLDSFSRPCFQSSCPNTEIESEINIFLKSKMDCLHFRELYHYTHCRIYN